MGAGRAQDAARAGRSRGLTFAFILAAALLVALHLWCIVDAVRTRRPWLWVIALLIVPLVSALAYLARRPKRSEMMTETKGGKPSELDLAHQYARAGRFELAIPHYRAADPSGRDGYIGFRLANAQLRTGDPVSALATLDAMGPVPIQHDPEFVPLLRAEVLVALGRKEEAADVYASVMPHPPSSTAWCSYADLLLELGRRDEARAVLEQLEVWLNRGKTPLGDRPAPQYRRAMEQLRELRATP